MKPGSSTLTARAPKGTYTNPLGGYLSSPDTPKVLISGASPRTVIYAKRRNGLWGGDAAITQRAKRSIEFKAKELFIEPCLPKSINIGVHPSL